MTTKARKRDKPGIIFVKQNGRAVPVSEYDEEQWGNVPEGSSIRIEIVDIDKRARDQLGAYWATLRDVVDATGKWPSPRKLHDALKWELGYVSLGFDLAGNPRVFPDSIALDEMEPDERLAFMTQAFAKIAEVTGIDLEALREDRKRRRAA